MRILHLSIGDPNVRAGGLNRYCGDLMREEAKLGHNVYLLYPGTFIASKHPRIFQRAHNVYEIFDALPVSISYGIDNPNRYMVPINAAIYYDFLSSLKPDIIHVHSIQGVHKEFFISAKELKIPIMFTTHDFFPICYKCNGACNKSCPENCSSCCRTSSLSAMKQRVIQSRLYQRFKTNKIIGAVKKNISAEYITGDSSYDAATDAQVIAQYKELNEYYGEIISTFSFIHYNSDLTKEISSFKYSNIPSRVIPISHSGINVCNNNSKALKSVGYFGGPSTAKGWKTISAVIQKMNRVNFDITFELYGGNYNLGNVAPANVHDNGTFNRENESKIWDSIDALIVPSIVPETFGFVVLEGIAHGKPVICTDIVGAKQLTSARLICEPNNSDEIISCLTNLISEANYRDVCDEIDSKNHITTMSEHTREILNIYGELC